MDGSAMRWMRRGRGVLGAVGLVVGGLVVGQAVLATFTTGTTVVSDPHDTAVVELALDSSGVARLEAGVSDLVPGDVRETLVRVAAAAGSVELADVAYQVTGTLLADGTPPALDPSGANVLDEPASRALAVEVRRCTAGSTFRVRTVDTPVAGALDVYCDRDSSGVPGSFDAGDDDGVLVGAVIDPVDGSARPDVPLVVADTLDSEGTLLNVRVVFADAGEQNDLQGESFTLSHTFTAGAGRAGGNR